MKSAKTAGAAKPRKPWGWHTRFRGHKQDELAGVTVKGKSKTVPLKWPDGRAVQAGDLAVGQEYEFDAVTGEVQHRIKVVVVGHEHFVRMKNQSQ